MDYNQNPFSERNAFVSMPKRSCRIIFLTLVVVLSFTVSGCLTLNPSVTADTSQSAVFENLSTDEPWASDHVRVNATLRSTPAAGNVTSIIIIGENGQKYASVSVASGQTVVPLWVPANRNSTLVATNSVNSTTIGTLNITTSGNRVF
jgi:hypothetical protein